MLNGLDLFSGIAGNSLGLGKYIRPIAYCERDRHAQSVLLSRMGDGSLAPAPIWDDISTLTRDLFDCKIDIIVGGFPCQDISVAGKGAGLEGERSGLFYEIMRLAKEIKPAFLFLENVPAIRTRGLDRVIEELTEAGYDCRWTMLSAAEVGAPHKRERWFCLARRRMSDTDQQHDQSVPRSLGETQGEERQQIGRNGFNCQGPEMAYSNRERLEIKQPGESGERATTIRTCPWTVEPDLDRVAYGIPFRVDRIKRIGNAVVPAQAKEAFEILAGIK